MGLALVSGPAIEPVTLEEAKAEARLDGTAEDARLPRLITAAREAVETETGRALITQTWDYVLPLGDLEWAEDWWDGVREGPASWLSPRPAALDLPKAPLQAILSVTAYAADGTGVLLDASTWRADTLATPGRLVWRTPPSIAHDGWMTARFRAGYGDAAAAVPAALRQAILDHVKAAVDGCAAGAPDWRRTVQPYRVRRL